MDSNSKNLMTELLDQVNSVLENESNLWRPSDDENRPGGLVLLDRELPTLIVPDLHGRYQYMTDLLRFKFKQSRIFELLKSEKVQIVCVGDGMHSERRGKDRWLKAFDEYKTGFEKCPAMAEEMSENFQTMAMVMKLKTKFPRRFHFLKGNHENILDEGANGNHPFAKFAAEGPMTRYYVEKFYGESFLKTYDRFEKNLPIMARGETFVITHSRPKFAFTIDEVINYRNHPSLIEGLTWTREEAAESGCVNTLLDRILGSISAKRLWFAGHTAIREGRYRAWKEEPLIEIHNPDKRTIVIVDPQVDFDLKQHIQKLPQSSDE